MFLNVFIDKICKIYYNVYKFMIGDVVCDVVGVI